MACPRRPAQASASSHSRRVSAPASSSRASAPASPAHSSEKSPLPAFSNAAFSGSTAPVASGNTGATLLIGLLAHEAGQQRARGPAGV